MKKQNQGKTKFEIIPFCRGILYGVLALIIIYNIIFLINTTINKKTYLRILGISILNTENYNISIIKNVKERELNNEDVIAYEINGKIRINRIINQYINEYNNQKEYITKSDLNYYPDIEPILYKQIIGKEIAKIDYWGFILKICESKIMSVIIMVGISYFMIINKYKIIRSKTKEKERYKARRYKIKND